MDKAQVFKGPEYFERSDDPEIMGPVIECEDVDGIHFCGAHKMQVGMRHDCKTDTMMIAILLSKQEHGYLWQLTCHGAREIGEGLIRMAQQLEEKQAAKAKAQLDAALQKGQPDGI